MELEIRRLAQFYRRTLKYDASNVIHPTALIYPNVVIGRNNYIGPYCVIGGPPEHARYWKRPIKHLKGVIIGDNNHFTSFCGVDAGTTEATTVLSDCRFLKNAQVGHDSFIGCNVTLGCNVVVGGHCAVFNGSNLGLGVVMHQKTEVPPGCMIGMNSTITKKNILFPHTKYAGSPVRAIGSNIRYTNG